MDPPMTLGLLTILFTVVVVVREAAGGYVAPEPTGCADCSGVWEFPFNAVAALHASPVLSDSVADAYRWAVMENGALKISEYRNATESFLRKWGLYASLMSFYQRADYVAHNERVIYYAAIGRQLSNYEGFSSLMLLAIDSDQTVASRCERIGRLLCTTTGHGDVFRRRSTYYYSFRRGYPLPQIEAAFRLTGSLAGFNATAQRGLLEAVERYDRKLSTYEDLMVEWRLWMNTYREMDPMAKEAILLQWDVLTQQADKWPVNQPDGKEVAVKADQS